MNKRSLKTLLYHSISSLIYPSKSPIFISHSLNLSRQNLFSIFTRFISASSPYNLPGLVDPDDPVLAEASQVESVSAEEFGFLRDSLMSSDANSVAQFDAGKCSNDAVLIANTILGDKDGFSDKTQQFLRQFRVKLSESLVVDVLYLIKNPELGVKFFIWASRQIGYSHTMPVYNALLELIECDHNERVPEEFLREIRNDDREVLGKLLNVLIRKCCRNGLWNVALEELGRLKDFGYKCTRVTYNALIQVFLRAGRLETANLVHREMLDAGFSMDVFTLGCYAHSLCRARRWREALTLIEKEEFVPDTVLYTKMISGLCEASLFEEAMDFLNRMRASSCIPNVVTFRILLCGCLRKKQLGRCKRILSMMISEGCYPSPRIFNSLVHAYCRSGDYSYAYKLLKKMVECGCQPGYVVYNILIGGICANEELPGPNVLDLAEKAYSEMLDAGVVLNKINVSNFSQCLCGAGKFEKAYSVIHEMMTLIDGHCKAGQIDKACQIYARLRGDVEIPDVDMYFKVVDSDIKEPNVFTHGALIDGMCKSHKVKEAHNLLDAMSAEGCEPNHIVYDALIDGFCKVGKLEEAQVVFSKMLEHGYSPNVYTYSTLIDRMFKDKRLDLALKVLSKMLENSCAPNVVIYTEMIDGLCKVGKTDEAYKLMLMMEEKGCYPNVVTYTAMIDGFGKLGKIDKCLQLFREMSSKGCAPNFVTYRVLINHCCASGLLDEAHKLLEEMKQTYWPRHVAGYRKVVEGLSREFIVALGLLDEMDKNDSVPIIPVYRILIDNFIKVGRLELALELHEEMASYSSISAVNKSTYVSLVESLSLAGKVDKAFELYVDMTRKGGVPQLSTFVHLIKGLIRVNRWEDALQLSDGICQTDINWLQEDGSRST
ncbi:hypothetical protein Patl1_26276 [Pistacia atlantica]|uniref:Uncharacterized protein n=1 Tax=Pistacia atlantica TaxID=434234 RepID=A0ACC1AYK9_9ROSI|nr:hypothetical protein Patl1_26276 [Pistacia atlantica]